MSKELAMVACDGERFGSWACGSVQLFIELSHILHAAIFFQPGITSVPHNLQQPSAHISAAKAVEETVRTQHRFLCDVFGIRAAAQKPTGEVKSGVEMREDKRFEAHLILRIQHVPT